MIQKKANFHLPGLFEFYEFYKVFLPLFKEHPEFFYDWCEIGSIYGAPADCLWGGGRVGFGTDNILEVHRLMEEFDISERLTFSNSLLTEEHLKDIKCNKLCSLVANSKITGGIIVHSDLLVNYLRKNYPSLYLISTTTKVLTDFNEFMFEIKRPEFSYVVPDFRLNKSLEELNKLSDSQKNKVEFLVNECCNVHCKDRKKCYETVSKKALGIECPEHICKSPFANEGYKFSRAMRNESFISVDDIQRIYMPMGFSNFKIEGRSLGSALLLEFILHYMTKPEYQIDVREAIYLDATLDIF